MLKKETIKKIRRNKQLKIDLCKTLDISPPTLQRWLDNNNPSLTRLDAMKVIARQLDTDIETLALDPQYQEQP